MNCTALDATLTHGEALAGDVERMVLIGLLAATSVALLVGGERFARPLAAAVGGGAFAVFAYVAWPGDCTPRLVAGGVAAALGVPITLFLFHNGITLVAATATGALAHTIATALPAPDVEVASMAAIPILAALVGGLLGAAAAIYRRVHVLRALTSLAGACGLAVTTVLLGAQVRQGYLVLGVGLVGLAGMGVQERCFHRTRLATPPRATPPGVHA